MAVKFVNQTNKHLFLTGKAGTGKTTFLKYIRENTFKKMAVVAPTGVAAINAGGVTMHSFFQLPFGPFIPTQQSGWNSSLNEGISNQHTLLRNIRLNNAKRDLLNELELLIIDEVSMVRADMLDAVDVILRHFRKQPLVPFGGVQMLYIGDLFQLPPVIKNEEWDLLRPYYKSPFFFDALVMQQTSTLYIELKKIYRQSDLTFINILNNIRNNIATWEDLEALHAYYKPGFRPDKKDNYITLTSHNAQADSINYRELVKLSGKPFIYEAEIKGDFNEKAFPAEKTLSLKAGAQIMFIKNDKGEARKFYNGKIGTIKSLDKEKIIVEFPNESTELEVKKEKWSNVKYVYNKEKDSIDEEELGTFEQYPVRLAWAITIHKSQGLTFSKAIIDAGSSFAPGQVYVALSRLTNMEGMVLYSRIHPHCISTDERVIAFTQSELPEDVLHLQLEESQKIFIAKSLLLAFNWEKIVDQLEHVCEESGTRSIPDKEIAVKVTQELLKKAWAQKETAQKFLLQLERLLEDISQQGFEQLHERMKAAYNYFNSAINTDLINPLQKHIDAVRVKKKTGKYVAALKYLKLIFERKQQQLHQSTQVTEGLVKGLQADALLQIVEDQRKVVIVKQEDAQEASPVVSTKPPKGETRRISLSMFREGKSINEIAAERNMVFSTIESHLASFIVSGEVKIEELVPHDKLLKILGAIKEIGDGKSTTPIKQKLGDDFSYGEIRAASYYYATLESSDDI